MPNIRHHEIIGTSVLDEFETASTDTDLNAYDTIEQLIQVSTAISTRRIADALAETGSAYEQLKRIADAFERISHDVAAIAQRKKA
jgi:hypothetical protein